MTSTMTHLDMPLGVTDVQCREPRRHELGQGSIVCPNHAGFAGDTSAYRATTSAKGIFSDLGGFWIFPNVAKTHHSQRQRPH